MEFSLVVSCWAVCTPGSMTSRPNRSRPFRVMLFIWRWSISFEFSLDAVWIGVAAAVTDTCSVIAPRAREIFPKSRTSLAVTSMFDLRVGLEARRPP